jgi:HK97 family phage portal protein
MIPQWLRWFGIGSLSNQDTGKQVGYTGGASTNTGISVTDDRAMQVSAVWACVQYITNSVVSLPLGFYEHKDDGRRILKNHALNDLFHLSPNQIMKPRDFRKAMTMQMCMWSNAYAEITWMGDRPVALTPLRPGRMTPHINDDGSLSYHYQMSQGVRVYSKKSIFHLKGFGSDGIVGLERSSYARETLGLSVSADTYAASQFANGGRSGGGYLMFDKFLTVEQREQARKLYEGMSETSFNKGKLWILEGGVDYKTDSLNPDTMQMIETRKMQLGEIARFFGVPEVLIGAAGSTSAWPASFEQQLLSFLTFTLQDYIDEWEHTIKYSLIAPRDKHRYFADHDVTGFIKMDSQTRAAIQSTQVQNGLKTRNEIRKTNNDPVVEGGDDLTVQVNLTPIDELEKVNDTQNGQPAGTMPAQVRQ